LLSLVFVPAMFMLMDDVGALCWRLGRKLIVSTAEPQAPRQDHADGRNAPPKIRRSPAAE
jgi:hypothetical protein